MHAPDLRCREGLTLVELMVVIVIVGVLAAIAVPAFGSYVYKSRASEATSFLGQIRQRQESYRSEFGQYACAPVAPCPQLTFTAFTPAALPPKGQVQSWVSTVEWDQLGARPDGPVRFQYATIAGPPGTTPAGVPGYDGSDFWFVAQARGDLDDDGTVVTFEAYSASTQVYVSEDKGWE